MNEALLKAIDSWCIYPLLRGLEDVGARSLARKIPPQIQELKRVLILRPGGLGDAALLLPLLRELRANGVEVFAAGMARNRGILDLFVEQGLVKKVWLLERIQDLFEIRKIKFDCVFDTEQGFLLSSLYSRFVRAEFRVGFDVGPRRVLLDQFVNYRQEDYEAQSFLNLLSVFGLKRSLSGESLRLDAISLPQATPEKKGRWLAFHGGGSGPGKRISLESCYKILSTVASSYDTIVLLGSNDCLAMNQELERILPRVINLAGKCSVKETVATLQHCEAFFGTDSAPLHLAVLAGVPLIVAIFGPSIEKKWALPERVVPIVNSTLVCRPCLYGRFAQLPPCPFSFACMAQAPTEQAIQALMAQEVVP